MTPNGRQDPAKPAPDSAAAIRMAYGPDGFQFGELRHPATPGPYPVLIVIHGGFWRSTYGLELMDAFCADFTAHGWATWNIEYRRVGNAGGGWPGTFLDVAVAADYLSTISSKHSLDLSRVVVIGHSAGGHLALWLAGRSRIPRDSPLFSAEPLPIQGAVSLAGVNDLRRAYELGMGGGAVAGLIGGGPDQFPDRYRDGSPYELIPLGIPTVLIHGTADVPVSIEMSERFHAHAIKANDPAKIVRLPDCGHMEVIDPRAKEWTDVRNAVNALVDSGPPVEKGDRTFRH